MTTHTDTLRQRLMDEADQCRQDGADDIARLLDEAATELQMLRTAARLVVQATPEQLPMALDALADLVKA